MSSSNSTAGAWVYLDPVHALEQIGDPQALRNMLPMLQEQLERDVPRIDQFISAGDRGGANPLLHSLKGCMPIFCAASLCEELAHVEHMTKPGASGEVQVAYTALRPKLLALQDEVANFLREPA